jgi:hypothetical protein
MAPLPQLSQQFASTAIRSGTYDTETQTMELYFISGRSYTFENVPEHVWDGLCAARSAGSYFAGQIKGRY